MAVLEDVFPPEVRALLRAASVRSGNPEPEDRVRVLGASGDYSPAFREANRQRFHRALRAAWEAYLSAAQECGLFEGDEGNDLIARLRSVDSVNFRAALAECMACWYLAGHMRLPIEPRPPGQDRKRLEFRSPRSDGDLLFEVKAPYVPQESDVWAGDDAPALQAALEEANRQFARGPKNVLVLVPSIRTPVHVARRQLVRALVVDEVVRMDLDRARGMFVNPRRELSPSGRFTRHWRSGSVMSPRYTRVGMVLCLEPTYTDRAMNDASIARQRFDLPNTFSVSHEALAVHNPYAITPVDQQVFAHIPQLVVEDESMRWTDGADILG